MHYLVNDEYFTCNSFSQFSRLTALAALGEVRATPAYHEHAQRESPAPHLTSSRGVGPVQGGRLLSSDTRENTGRCEGRVTTDPSDIRPVTQQFRYALQYLSSILRHHLHNAHYFNFLAASVLSDLS